MQSSDEFPLLFSPLKLGNLTLPNRVVMAPMSTQLANADGTVNAAQVAFYQARAMGGTGLIIVELCCVDAARGRSESRELILEHPFQVEGHIPLVNAIRESGAVACLQLQHGGPGVKRSLMVDGVAVGPSDVASRRDPSRLSTRALQDEEIEDIIERFGRSAQLAVQAGYQAIELHGAHGYLLTTFLTPLFNQRDDRWGGDEQRRMQLPLRVIQRVKQAIGDRPLIYRLSADEFSPQGLGIADIERITPHLVAAGADAIHVSIGLGSTSFDKVIEPMSTSEGWRLPYARRVRAVAKVPVIAVGQIRWPSTAEAALRDGDADLIALGRPLLADPQWAIKARRGMADDIRPCTSCNYCISLGMDHDESIGCAENPRTGHELDSLPDAGVRRGQRAIVIGGGPAGMSAALMLSQAGFATQLYESRAQLGGGLIASAAPPFKDKLTWYQRYLEQRLARSNVSVRMNASIDIEQLVQAKPYLVILASGSRPKKLDVAGWDLPIVNDAYALLMGEGPALPPPGELPLLVYGGGETGCEAAEYLAELGHQVLLVSRSPASQLARAAEMIYRTVLLKRLKANPRIRIISDTHLTAIRSAAVTLRAADGTVSECAVSRVLVAQGSQPNAALARQLSDHGIRVAVIGDARQGGRIGDAVRDAYQAVLANSESQPVTPSTNAELLC